MAETNTTSTRSATATGARRPAFDELVNSYKANCKAAEEASLEFLGVEIGLQNMPLINIPTLRDLVKREFWVLLRLGKRKFTSTVENAMFLFVLTDYVTCAVRSVQLFDIFLNKTDVIQGIPALLAYINKQWLSMFVLSSPPYDITERQLCSVVSLLKMAVNRLPFQAYRDCFKCALNAADYQLKLVNPVVQTKEQHCEESAYGAFQSTAGPEVSNRKRKSHDEEPSYTSIKNCEVPKYATNLTIQQQILSRELLDRELFQSKPAGKIHIPIVRTLDIAPRAVSETQNEVPKTKKSKFSSDITKYMCVSKNMKDSSSNNSQRILEKKILEATSKENIQIKESETRAVTPPSVTVCDDDKKDNPITPIDQPTVVNLCSPIKKIPSPGKTMVSTTENGKKNAFAIMMQRSKENSKRKSLFSDGPAKKS